MNGKPGERGKPNLHREDYWQAAWLTRGTLRRFLGGTSMNKIRPDQIRSDQIDPLCVVDRSLIYTICLIFLFLFFFLQMAVGYVAD